MYFYRTITSLLLLVIFTILMGCSGGGSNPVMPGQNPASADSSGIPPISDATGNPLLSERIIENPYATDLSNPEGIYNALSTLGEYELFINPDTANAELVSIRKSSIGESFTVSGASYFTINPCTDCLKIKSLELTVDGLIKLVFAVTHPYQKGTLALAPSAKNRLDLDLFDLAIVVVPMSASFRSYPLMDRSAYTEICTKIDGFTPELSNLTRNPMLCPYYLVIDNSRTGLETYNRFEMGTVEQLVNTFFKGGGYFKIYLTMGYGASAILETRLSPTYYNPEFNRKAAWKVVVFPPNGTSPPALGNTWDDADATTPYTVDVRVYDWQQGATVADPYPDPANTNYILKASNVQSVSVEIPGMTNDLKTVTTPASGVGSVLDPLIYEVPIQNEKHLAPGKYTALVKVFDERVPPVDGVAGQPDTLVDSPDGVTLRWFDIPEYATYQSFTATVLAGKKITVTSPNGGETWAIDSSQTISWTWGGSIPNVNVELSLDGGANYTIPVANNIPNTGSLIVNPVGNWPTTQARIRVYDPIDLAIVDQSDADFTIKREIGPIEVTCPNGGENWNVGTGEEITWNAEVTINFVRISLSLDGGVTYPTVLTGSTANDGSWMWSNIPGEDKSNQCRIKINNILNELVYDESDADFAIICPLPNPPTTVSASDGAWPDKVQVTWDTVSGATSYSVYRDSVLQQSGIAGTIWVDTAAVPNTTYSYQVSSKNICGEGALSNPDDGWVCILPGAPPGVIATDGLYPDKVEVSWTAIAEATGYNIYRDDVLQQSNWTGGTTWNDTTAVPGTHYNYSVSSVNSCGESPKSLTDEGWKCQLPEMPDNVVATDGTFFDKVDVSWDVTALADEYNIYRDGLLQQSGWLLTTWTDTTATPGTHYQYTISGVNTCGEGPQSNPDEGWMCVMPSTPTDVSASDGAFPDKVVVSWTPAGAATGYNIFRDLIEIEHDWGAVTYNDTTAIQGVIYSYTVSSLNSCGESSQSAADTGWTCITAPVPTGVTATDGLFPDRVTVSWNLSIGAIAYNIYRDGIMVENNWLLIIWDDTTIVPGTHYNYTVSALNACGESSQSPADEGWACTLPGVPSNVQASDGTFLTLVQIDWDAVVDATQYDIFRDSIEIVSDVVGTTYQDNTVSGGVVYSYQVRAENSCGVSGLSTADTGYAQGCTADTNDTFLTADRINLHETLSGCIDMVDEDWFLFYVSPNGISNGTIDLTVLGGTAEMRLYGSDPGEAAPGTLVDNNNNIVINNNTYSRYYIRLIGLSGQVSYDLTTNITAAITNIDIECYVAEDGSGNWPIWEAPDPDEVFTLATLTQMVTWVDNFWNLYGYNLAWDGTPTMMSSQYYILDNWAEVQQMHMTYGFPANILSLYFVDVLNSGNTAYCLTYAVKLNHNYHNVITVYSPNIWYWQDVIAHEHGHGIGYYFDEYLYDSCSCACGDNGCIFTCLGYTPYLYTDSTGCYNGNLMWYAIPAWTWDMFDLTVGQEQNIHQFHFEYPTNYPSY